MAGNKYTKVNSSGDLEEQAALQSSSGAGDAGSIVALDAGGLISTTMLPSSGARTMTASEAIAAGDMINVHDSSGAKVRLADCSNGRRAHGFATEAISNAASGVVNIGDGINSDKSSLTIGAEYFLTTAGGITTTPPTTATHLLQPVGVAVSATELQVILKNAIKRA
ncbi:MAG: hypothetical protein K2X93_17265 [Candidatus Obscuribacterales bacterium]|nr:hypothetical protein [Candidatus Obscuribacterales bacterium]